MEKELKDLKEATQELKEKGCQYAGQGTRVEREAGRKPNE
jgi:hypothetical protein